MPDDPLEITIRSGGFTIVAENEHRVAEVTMTVSRHARPWMIHDLATEAVNELNRRNGATDA